MRLAIFMRHPLVLGAAFVALPVHHQRPIVFDLQPIHSHITDVRDRIACDDLRQRDVLTTIERPALEDRQFRK